MSKETSSVLKLAICVFGGLMLLFGLLWVIPWHVSQGKDYVTTECICSRSEPLDTSIDFYFDDDKGHTFSKHVYYKSFVGGNTQVYVLGQKYKVIYRTRKYISVNRFTGRVYYTFEDYDGSKHYSIYPLDGEPDSNEL